MLTLWNNFTYFLFFIRPIFIRSGSRFLIVDFLAAETTLGPGSRLSAEGKLSQNIQLSSIGNPTLAPIPSGT